MVAAPKMDMRTLYHTVRRVATRQYTDGSRAYERYYTRPAIERAVCGAFQAERFPLRRAQSAIDAVRYSRSEIFQPNLQTRFEDFLAYKILTEAGRRGLPTLLFLAWNSPLPPRFVDSVAASGSGRRGGD